jgi:hypothetical protein
MPTAAPGLGNNSQASTQSATRTTSGARKPKYISPGLTSAELYIDGNDAGPFTCTTTCSASFSSIPGTHTFGVLVSDQSDGQDLGEGEQSYTLAPGNNGTLSPPLTVNGVVATAAEVAQSIGEDSGYFTFAFGDADNYQIVQPGVFDGGPITAVIYSTGGNATVTNSSVIGPAGTTPQTVTLDFTCTQVGTFDLIVETGTSPANALEPSPGTLNYGPGTSFDPSGPNGSNNYTLYERDNLNCAAATGNIPIQGHPR